MTKKFKNMMRYISEVVSSINVARFIGEGGEHKNASLVETEIRNRQILARGELKTVDEEYV